MKTLKIATWNVNSLRVRLQHLLDWLVTEKPDIVGLQELKMVTESFPHDAIREAGYEVVVNGQKTYNGVAILSRAPAEDIVMDIPGFTDLQRRVLAVTVEGVRILNLYVPNGERVGSEKYQYKLNWLTHLTHFVQQELELYPHLIVLGDFNIAPEVADVYDPIALEGRVLFSEPERAAFQSLLSLGLVDCFRLSPKPPETFSWWDYRMYSFQRNQGLRIDHILASSEFSSHCQSCVIDQNPRGWERPSDHAPVIADFWLDS